MRRSQNKYRKGTHLMFIGKEVARKKIKEDQHTLILYYTFSKLAQFC